MGSFIPIVSAAAVSAGIFSHLAFFRIGEHHLYGMSYLLNTIATIIMMTLMQGYLLQSSLSTSSSRSLTLAACFFGGLYGSLIAFRIFFHPLRSFPGPFGCKVSSVWFATYLAKRNAFYQLDRLHHTYGHFLRIGSNDLSISHPKAVQAIYGPGSRCRKAAWYDLTHPMVSLQSTRNKTLHDQRRRMWSGAFGDKNLRDYEKRMAQYRTLLVKAIDQSGSRPMDVTKWFSLYNFDVMGDLAFGSSFQMLETSKEHEAVKLLNSGLTPLGFMLPVWLFRFATSIPGLARDWWKFIGYCTSQLEHRLQMKIDTPDIMSSLLKNLHDKIPTGLDRALLEGDSQLIVVAGSDTTASTLTSIFKLLIQHPEHITLIRAELEHLARTEVGDYFQSDLVNLKHLSGVMNEALRLYPPVPSALQRLSPPEGLVIDGTFVPGNVTIYCPQYVLGRNPECFVSPEKFIPERWYSRPDLVRDASGFAPFSTGPYGCIGRPLALLNIRQTLSRIIADYDVRLADGVRPAAYDDALTEHFTLAFAPLYLCFNRCV